MKCSKANLGARRSRNKQTKQKSEEKKRDKRGGREEEFKTHMTDRFLFFLPFFLT